VTVFRCGEAPHIFAPLGGRREFGRAEGSPIPTSVSTRGSTRDHSLSTADREQCESARRLARERFSEAVPPAGFDHAAWRCLADFGVFQVDLRDKSACFPRATRLLEAFGTGGADRGLWFAAGAHVFGCLWPLLHFEIPHNGPCRAV